MIDRCYEGVNLSSLEHNCQFFIGDKLVKAEDTTVHKFSLLLSFDQFEQLTSIDFKVTGRINHPPETVPYHLIYAWIPEIINFDGIESKMDFSNPESCGGDPHYKMTLITSDSEIKSKIFEKYKLPYVKVRCIWRDKDLLIFSRRFPTNNEARVCK